MSNDNQNNEFKFDNLYQLLKNGSNEEQTFFDYRDNVFITNDNFSDELENKIISVNNMDEDINDNTISNIDEKIDNIQKRVIEPKEIVTSSIINNIKTDNKIDNYDKNRVNEIKKKENNNKEIIYDDGIDTDSYNKNDILSILTNKKFLLFVAVFAFIFVCIVVAKAFYFGKKVDTYEEYFTEITEKEEEIAKVYENKEIDTEVLKKVAASELIGCINSKVDTDKLPDSVKNIINEINNYYNQSYNYFAFLYKDIFTGFTVSYNANQNIFTASTIKAPTDLYIYEMASEGKIDLDEELTYTGWYYNTGTGVLKNKPINTKYSVRTLLEYSTVYSDNAAHNMLMDKYGRDNMLKFWQEKGTNAIFTANNNWGIINAHDASIYMEELYKFYVNDSEYGDAIMKNFMNARPKFISGKNNYVVANKSGWSGTAIHDVSIVFSSNPYIVVALSNLGNTDYYMSYFNRANDLAYRLHTEYWKYKMEMCGSIKQY